METVGQLGDPDVLAFMGIRADPSVWPSPEEVLNDVETTEQQNSIAAKAWNLVIGLLWFRLASLSWHDQGWPGQFALFASLEESD